jgi:hypothetical protein
MQQRPRNFHGGLALQIRKVSGVAFDLEAVAAAAVPHSQGKNGERAKREAARGARINQQYSDALVSPPSKALFGI